MEKSPEAFRTIREVADGLDLPQHVLRFWETRFPQIRPLKRAGGRRYYRPDDIERLRLIKRLLYDEGYTIKGVQRLFRERGVQSVADTASRDGLRSPERADLREPPENETDAETLDSAKRPARRSNEHAQCAEIRGGYGGGFARYPVPDRRGAAAARPGALARLVRRKGREHCQRWRL